MGVVDRFLLWATYLALAFGRVKGGASVGRAPSLAVQFNQEPSTMDQEFQGLAGGWVGGTALRGCRRLK